MNIKNKLLIFLTILTLIIPIPTLAYSNHVILGGENLGIEMELDEIKCVHSSQNNQCIGVRCPFR